MQFSISSLLALTLSLSLASAAPAPSMEKRWDTVEVDFQGADSATKFSVQVTTGVSTSVPNNAGKFYQLTSAFKLNPQVELQTNGWAQSPKSTLSLASLISAMTEPFSAALSLESTKAKGLHLLLLRAMVITASLARHSQSILFSALIALLAHIAMVIHRSKSRLGITSRRFT
jgi:hypothetical protein